MGTDAILHCIPLTTHFFCIVFTPHISMRIAPAPTMKYRSVISKEQVFDQKMELMMLCSHFSANMGAIYEEHKDEDGFLYVAYSGENTFGC